MAKLKRDRERERERERKDTLKRGEHSERLLGREKRRERESFH